MMTTAGEKLRIARENLGLTQEVFAQLLSVPGNTVARWERGLLAPTGAHRKKVEQFLAIMDNPKGKEALSEAIRTGGIPSGSGFLGLLGGVMGSTGVKNIVTAAGLLLISAAVGAGIVAALNMVQEGSNKRKN